LDAEPAGERRSRTELREERELICSALGSDPCLPAVEEELLQSRYFGGGKGCNMLDIAGVFGEIK
jgi:hypothetical protein